METGNRGDHPGGWKRLVRDMETGVPAAECGKRERPLPLFRSGYFPLGISDRTSFLSASEESRASLPPRRAATCFL